MTPILTASAMRDADRRAIDELGIPGAVLMENAARGSCEVLAELLGSLSGKRIAIICGRGNNGGDGLALARHAMLHGADVVCAMLDGIDDLSPDAAMQYRILTSYAPDVPTPWENFKERYEIYDAVVDAMLGTGSRGAPRGAYAEGTQWINSRAGTTLAIDIPTGVDSDTGRIATEAVRADATATMAALKPGLLINDGPDHAGRVRTVHIGAPHLLYLNSSLGLLDAPQAAAALPHIDRRRHKYNRGKILICAGSKGMTGAGIMAAESALRTGAGLVVLAMPDAALPAPQHIVPEIMTRSLDSTDDGAFAADAIETLRSELGSYTTIAVGPGISRSGAAAAFTRTIVGASTVPVVLDADGLGAYIGKPESLAERYCDLVITPHYGELATLLNIDKEAIAEDPVGVACDAALRINGIVALKGAPTIVAEPSGRAWINAAGNPGMASGGVGDVLTGMVASLIAQTGNAERGTLAAVFLHSLAADLAAARSTVRSLTATDIIDSIPNAYQSLTA